MEKWITTATDKKTGEIKVLNTYDTEEKAIRDCESWGWIYDDGKKSYWMNYEAASTKKGA